MPKTIDYNSVENQRIKSAFVQREVMTCFSYEMDAVLNASSEGAKDLPMWDEIENLYVRVCPHCGEPFEDVSGEAMQETCQSCGQRDRDNDAETEMQEIFEWWIVTNWLYEKLKEKNEPVLEWGNNYYWGRTCTGQAIMLDWVISEICAEMEILQGQKYEWKNV